MKKYISALVLSVMFLLPAVSQAQVSSTVQKRVVPVLKKAYETTVSTTSPVTASSVPRSVLKQGMKGEDVRYMQAFLYNQGQDIDIDGVFGPGTKRALIAFQKSTNGALSTDGVFGPRTALYIQDMPTGIAVKNLDKGTVDYLKGQHIAKATGKEVNTRTITEASKAKTVPPTSRSVIAKLPKDVKSVLSKALPQAPKLTPLQVASSTTPTSTIKPTTKKPKAEILALVSRAKVSLVSATGAKGNLVASANLNTNLSTGEAGKATKEYICAEWGGDNTCVAVSGAIASAVKAGQLDARDVLAEILGNDGQCPFCSKDENGGLVLTSGGGCGAGGGPGSGEFITPPGTPVGTDPDACVPFADIAGKAYSLAVTSDNVFTAYWGVKGADGNETLQIIGKDMNWDEPTATGTSTQPGWKSAESFSGTAPANPLNIYFAAFHDGWVTHGFMASLTAGKETYETGSPVFEVAKSSVPGPIHPADFVTNEVLTQIKNATWAQTFLVDTGEHGMSPWGVIPGIPRSAKWIFEGNNWDPEGKMASYEIYRLKICGGTPSTPTATIDDVCMNFRTDENGQPTNGKTYYRVTFSEPMVVTGTPRLLVKKNASAPIVTAIFDSYADPEHKVLKFVADIGSGLNAGIDSPYYEGAATIEHVNGSVIKTVSGGVNAPLSVGTFAFSDTCIASPVVLSGAANYRPLPMQGEDPGNLRADYDITFNIPVTVTGVPKLKIVNDVNGQQKVHANYISGSGTTTLRFHASESSVSGATAWEIDYEGTGIIDLNGGTIKGATGANANITVPASVIFDNLLVN